MMPKFYRVRIERRSTGSVMRSVIACDGPSRVVIGRLARRFYEGFRVVQIDDLTELEFLRDRKEFGEFLDGGWFLDASEA